MKFLKRVYLFSADTALSSKSHINVSANRGTQQMEASRSAPSLLRRISVVLGPARAFSPLIGPFGGVLGRWKLMAWRAENSLSLKLHRYKGQVDPSHTLAYPTEVFVPYICSMGTAGM